MYIGIFFVFITFLLVMSLMTGFTSCKTKESKVVLHIILILVSFGLGIFFLIANFLK